MKKIIIFTLFFSFFLFSCSNSEKIESNSWVVETEKKEKQVLKYFKEQWDFLVYEKDNYKFQISKNSKFDIIEDYFESDFFAIDKDNNNFSFSNVELSKYDVKTLEEAVEFFLENLKNLTKNPDLKSEKVEFKGLKWYKISYNAWWALIEENIFPSNEEWKILVLRPVVFEWFSGDEIEQIMNSFEIKK